MHGTARFADIDLIALTELNGIVAKARRDSQAVDVSRIDARLLKNLPLDVRVVLAWDADNTDVDLHVIDPNGEEVYYGHNASYQGGTITPRRDRRLRPGGICAQARQAGQVPHRGQLLRPSPAGADERHRPDAVAVERLRDAGPAGPPHDRSASGASAASAIVVGEFEVGGKAALAAALSGAAGGVSASR